MVSINEQAEQADSFWGYWMSSMRMSAYVAIGVICVKYDGLQHFLHGYFLALAVWLFGFGDPIPEKPAAAGMAAIAFVCFFAVKLMGAGFKHGELSILAKRWDR